MRFFKSLFGQKESQKKNIDYDNIISKYSELMEQSALVRKESELPATKEQIREVLNWASTHPIYKSAEKELTTGLLYLDHFVPDSDYDKISHLVTEAMQALREGDNEKYKLTVNEIPEKYQVLFKSMFSTFLVNTNR